MRFTTIDQHNYRQVCSLRVMPEQSGYLSSAPMILARAYAFRHQNSEVSVIEEGEDQLGLVMTREAEPGRSFWINSLLISGFSTGAMAGKRWNCCFKICVNVR